MTRRAISTTGAPAAIGPYSQGIVTDGLLFSAGQAALDPATGTLVEGGIEPETERVMANLTAVLDAAGATWGDVVKTTIFLVDMADFATVNAIYGRFVADPPPARSTVGVAALPKGARVEIEAIVAAALAVDTLRGPPLRCPDPLMTADPIAPDPDRVGSDDRPRPVARRRALVNPQVPPRRPARSPSCWRPASARG